MSQFGVAYVDDANETAFVCPPGHRLERVRDELVYAGRNYVLVVEPEGEAANIRRLTLYEVVKLVL